MIIAQQTNVAMALRMGFTGCGWLNWSIATGIFHNQRECYKTATRPGLLRNNMPKNKNSRFGNSNMDGQQNTRKVEYETSVSVKRKHPLRYIKVW